MYEYYNSRHNKEKICTENKGYVTYIWDIDGIITLVITTFLCSLSNRRIQDSCNHFRNTVFKFFSSSLFFANEKMKTKWETALTSDLCYLAADSLRTVDKFSFRCAIFKCTTIFFFSAMNNTFRVKSMLSALHWRFYRPTITMMKSINISKHLFFPSAKLCNSES